MISNSPPRVAVNPTQVEIGIVIHDLGVRSSGFRPVTSESAQHFQSIPSKGKITAQCCLRGRSCVAVSRQNRECRRRRSRSPPLAPIDSGGSRIKGTGNRDRAVDSVIISKTVNAGAILIGTDNSAAIVNA